MAAPHHSRPRSRPSASQVALLKPPTSAPSPTSMLRALPRRSKLRAPRRKPRPAPLHFPRLAPRESTAPASSRRQQKLLSPENPSSSILPPASCNSWPQITDWIKRPHWPAYPVSSCPAFAQVGRRLPEVIPAGHLHHLPTPAPATRSASPSRSTPIRSGPSTTPGILMMKKQPMTKKSLDGNIYMGMSSGSLRTSHYFQLLLALELSCLLLQPLYSCLRLLEYSTPTTVVHFSLHWSSSMHSLLDLLGTSQPLPTIS